MRVLLWPVVTRMPTSLRISLLITPLGGDAGQGEGGKKPVEGGKPAEGKPEAPAEGAKPAEWGGATPTIAA